MANERWCCRVCGYIHLGETLPECCPVCGAKAEHFEPSAPLPDPVESVPGRWRCMNCDFIHEGQAAPSYCTVCGAGREQFEPVAEQERDGGKEAMAGDIVVIGGGIAGLSAAEAARKNSPDASITLVCQEDDLPYYRLNLTRYLAGEITVSNLKVHPESWYAERRITLLRGAEAISIDRSARRVTLKNNSTLSYDRLILAMGAHPSIPPLPGTELEHVATLRTRRDAEMILRQSRPGAKCVIVGGGVLGLETAAALARRDVRVTLAEGFDWLLPRQLNRVAGERLADIARGLGINLVCGARIKKLAGMQAVQGVVLEPGETIPADLVIIAAGVRTNSYLARMAGLEVSNGVVVDQHMRTSDPDIFAAGDLAEHQGILYGTWAPAQYQGTIAGMNAAGGNAIFGGIPRSNSIKVLGVDLFSIGMVHPDDASYLVFEDAGDVFQQFVFRDSHLVGAVLMGDVSLASAVKKLIESHASCAELLAAARDPREIRTGISRMV